MCLLHRNLAEILGEILPNSRPILLNLLLETSLRRSYNVNCKTLATLTTRTANAVNLVRLVKRKFEIYDRNNLLNNNTTRSEIRRNQNT